MRLTFLVILLGGSTLLAEPMLTREGKYQMSDNCTLAIGGPLIDGLNYVVFKIAASFNHTLSDCNNATEYQKVVAQMEPNVCTTQVTYDDSVFIPGGGIPCMGWGPSGPNNTYTLTFVSLADHPWKLYIGADGPMKVIYNRTNVAM